MVEFASRRPAGCATASTRPEEQQVSAVVDETRHAHRVVNNGGRSVYDKLAMVVGRTKLTTRATIDVSWRKKTEKSAVRSLKEIPEGNTLIFEATRIPV